MKITLELEVGIETGTILGALTSAEIKLMEGNIPDYLMYAAICRKVASQILDKVTELVKNEKSLTS